MTMREKVARALLKSQWPTVTWDNCMAKEPWFHSADAALSALETPDEGMVEAGKAAWELQPQWVESGPGSDGLRDDITIVYTAMIRHARTGKDPTP